VKIEWRNF